MANDVTAMEIETFSDPNTTEPGAMEYDEFPVGSDMCQFFGSDGGFYQFNGGITITHGLGGSIKLSGRDSLIKPDTGEDLGMADLAIVVNKGVKPSVTVKVTNNAKVLLDKAAIPILNGVVRWGDGTYSTIRNGVSAVSPVAAPAHA